MKFAGTRAATLGAKFSHRVAIPNDKLVLEKGRVIHAGIKKVQSKWVELDNGKQLPYDYLVCATGGRNISPGEPPKDVTSINDIKEWYNNMSARIQEASSILVVGGGPVGVEMCGEIKSEYPWKEVHLVNAGGLIDNCSPPVLKSFSRQLKKQLGKIGVFVHTNERADIPIKRFKDKAFLDGKRTVNTDKGTRIECDLVLRCTGFSLNNSMYPSNWKTEKGLISVRSTLQCVASENVFAVGDINDVYETKQGYFAMRQGQVAAANIVKLIYGDKGVSLKKYKPGFGLGKTFMFVSVGRNGGASNLGYLSLGNLATRNIKSKNMFVEEQWKLYRIKDFLHPEVRTPPILQKSPSSPLFNTNPSLAPPPLKASPAPIRGGNVSMSRFVPASPKFDNLDALPAHESSPNVKPSPKFNERPEPKANPKLEVRADAPASPNLESSTTDNGSTDVFPASPVLGNKGLATNGPPVKRKKRKKKKPKTPKSPKASTPGNSRGPKQRPSGVISGSFHLLNDPRPPAVSSAGDLEYSDISG